MSTTNNETTMETLEAMIIEYNLTSDESRIVNITRSIADQLEAMKTMQPDTMEMYDAFLDLSGLVIEVYENCPREKLSSVVKLVAVCYSKLDMHLDSVNESIYNELMHVRKQLGECMVDYILDHS